MAAPLFHRNNSVETTVRAHTVPKLIKKSHVFSFRYFRVTCKLAKANSGSRDSWLFV